MDTSASKRIDLHYESLPKNTVKAFEFLSTQSWLETGGWYLAGGTALALQTGHRKSVDLDFFTIEKDFTATDVLSHFVNVPSWKTEMDRKNTIYGSFEGAKVSFIAYPFFVPKTEYVHFGSIRIIQPRDIAVMKIIAVSQRGRKRDFFDLYWTAHHLETLEETIRRLPEQYPSVAHDYHHILKALVYFDDAESDPDPELNFNVDWKEVKSFFEKEIPLILNKLIGD
ncbi:MAG: hypothetical protein A3G52_00695 [Candidatus Taylorbacteria bacterium RIFCSPLOWO2_12_FULL_43_20]|uniref:Nucleotidyl transferase AbiEii/AbiGii toxin family protein n=1 Tax=Candidatus Taylorbacteria bacterium RIFCSPLOWO2_12_FULL_43_20 TaxID=1802332 RepID=A0A1G2NZW2_9BACT|nr:MAG: hypothetical protein A3B98_01130 [Candidatus Taylorbacteria bacterium RIFCSPHIGHO2_02_FULL_43_55]OHA29598.1 MAG: hypothetical protein A3E92_04050 [Candidatus Taylorbacteria bacterium RIFCSPHIGHO2_12_FULL_42_34]OHA37583.1 MAG: hypothetical protein A3H58_02055 [Candidatus Taylorbacteria bacterium RIFCSPLOWO2_02_FULL_43_22b]OHA41610.1 MAG: hypothetical protein A3G52_00695 [Candidatus Taylorbacteria bacterium RIFCSPLOWO2_12_FULL_43_20]